MTDVTRNASQGRGQLQYDALFAALVAFCVTLALFLFFQWVVVGALPAGWAVE